MLWKSWQKEAKLERLIQLNKANIHVEECRYHVLNSAHQHIGHKTHSSPLVYPNFTQTCKKIIGALWMKLWGLTTGGFNDFLHNLSGKKILGGLPHMDRALKEDFQAYPKVVN